jgi:uncharacterized protein (DUF362 family)
MGKVSIVKTSEGIASALLRALDLIGGLERYIRRQDTVMLKPNLNGTEGVTNLALVESLIRFVSDFGARKIIIAESTFGNERMTDMCFAKTGYTEMARRHGVDLINLNRSETVEVPVKRPHVLDKLRIAKEVLETDSIINVPVMKVHYATAITLFLKNLKGFLVLGEKRHFHEIGLDEAIVDLNNTIQPNLNILDCIQAMERMGPRGGDLVDLNLLIAGGSGAETDYVGCRVMEHALEEVKHLQLYIQDNKIDLSQIEVLGESIDRVKYPFQKAKMSGAVPQGFSVHDINACSSCMNALLLSFQFLEKPVSQAWHVYVGRKIDPTALSDGGRIAFGNCCDQSVKYDRVVRGCPPYPYDLKRLLEG